MNSITKRYKNEVFFIIFFILTTMPFHGFINANKKYQRANTEMVLLSDIAALNDVIINIP